MTYSIMRAFEARMIIPMMKEGAEKRSGFSAPSFFVMIMLSQGEIVRVLMINGEFPAGRLFGAVMEYEDKLYISTNDINRAHSQLRKNGNIQILAKKENSREWLRITGKAQECSDIRMKEKVLDTYGIINSAGR